MPILVQAKQAAKQAKKDVKMLEQQLKDKTKEIEKMTAKLRKMGAHGAAIATGGGVGLALAGTGEEGDMSPGCVHCMQIFVRQEGALPIRTVDVICVLPNVMESYMS